MRAKKYLGKVWYQDNGTLPSKTRIYLRDQAIATPLCNQSEERTDEESHSHTMSPEYLRPTYVRGLLFQLYSLLDLDVFQFDEFGVFIAFSVILDQDLFGFFAPTFGD